MIDSKSAVQYEIFATATSTAGKSLQFRKESNCGDLFIRIVRNKSKNGKKLELKLDQSGSTGI
jgi:hypothetical protein